MMRIICVDHITTATTPLPNLYRMKRTSHNYNVFIPGAILEVKN